MMVSEKNVKKVVEKAIENDKSIDIKTLDYQEVNVSKYLEDNRKYLYKNNINDSYRSIVLQMWYKYRNSEEYLKIKQDLSNIRNKSGSLEKFKEEISNYFEKKDIEEWKM